MAANGFELSGPLVPWLTFQDSHNSTIALESRRPRGRLTKIPVIFWGSEWLGSQLLATANTIEGKENSKHYDDQPKDYVENSRSYGSDTSHQCPGSTCIHEPIPIEQTSGKTKQSDGYENKTYRIHSSIIHFFSWLPNVYGMIGIAKL